MANWQQCDDVERARDILTQLPEDPQVAEALERMAAVLEEAWNRGAGLDVASDLALAHSVAGHARRARRLAAEVATRYPGESGPWVTLAWVLVEDGRYRAAVDPLRAAYARGWASSPACSQRVRVDPEPALDGGRLGSHALVRWKASSVMGPASRPSKCPKAGRASGSGRTLQQGCTRVRMRRRSSPYSPPRSSIVVRLRSHRLTVGAKSKSGSCAPHQPWKCSAMARTLAFPFARFLSLHASRAYRYGVPGCGHCPRKIDRTSRTGGIDSAVAS